MIQSHISPSIRQSVSRCVLCPGMKCLFALAIAVKTL